MVYISDSIFCSLNEAIQDLKAGKLVCISDTEDIENEIDMMCLGVFATPENINYMITHARGLVCCAMSSEITDKLLLEPQRKAGNQDKRGTPFYESLDLATADTGVSAYERSDTILHIASGNAKRSDFISPAHTMTLRAKPNLLFARLGHTEFSVQMAQLCGVTGVAVICEIIKDDGTMLRVNEFQKWNGKHNLKLYSINQLLEYLTKVE